MIWDISHTIYPKSVYTNSRLLEGGVSVNAKEAVAKRIQTLCAERGITVNALANQSGVEPSTIYSMLGAKSQNPGIVTIQKLCDGLDISVRDFFDDQIFDGLEPVIK